MEKEKVFFSRTTEIRLKGPQQLDQFSAILVRAGLIAYLALRHPLTYTFITTDLEKRKVYLQSIPGGKANS